MIKLEIIDKISNYFRLTQFEAEKIYDDIFAMIMQGVKEDNIVDIANFGEFIIKYDNGKSSEDSSHNISGGTAYKRTVEFLASTGFEEELSSKSYENTKDISDRYIRKEPEVSSESTSEDINRNAVEEELRKKREAILSKLTTPIISEPLETRSFVTPADDVKQPEQTEPVPPVPVSEPEKIAELPASVSAESTSTEVNTEVEPVLQGEDISKKSFSDYLSEKSSSVYPAPEQDKELEPLPTVIPAAAVELHKEIVQQTLEKEPPAVQPQESAIPSEQVGRKAADNSYYIWYKDSESNPTDTQNLSYEYELLYQATKEAEYKSKLKIYVTTFILFFSLVLILLIFSPLIYKVLFTPGIENMESAQEQQNEQIAEQKATPNVLPPSNEQPGTQPADTVKKTEAPPVTAEQNQTQQQPPQQQAPPEQKKEEVQTQQPPPQTVTEPNIEGVTKNSMGWQDSKFNVVYVKLDNGKYAVQESAWDSEAKANKRINIVDGLKISGLKGSTVKVDIPNKGTWFRVRFGEFSSLQEARAKSEELRKKEK